MLNELSTKTYIIFYLIIGSDWNLLWINDVNTFLILNIVIWEILEELSY
jgi:hypothetical protein